MRIRSAVSEDSCAVAAIYRPYVEKTSVSFEYAAPTDEQYEARIRLVQDFFPFFVCEQEGRIVGFAYAHRLHEREAFSWSCETSIYVAQDRRGSGVGHALYARLLSALKEMGFAKAYAVLGCPNEESRLFHLREGFAEEGELKDVGYKRGAWHSVLYMSRQLNVWDTPPCKPISYAELLSRKGEERS